MTIRGIQCSIISAHLYIVNWEYQRPGCTGCSCSECSRKIANRVFDRVVL